MALAMKGAIEMEVLFFSLDYLFPIETKSERPNRRTLKSLCTTIFLMRLLKQT